VSVHQKPGGRWAVSYYIGGRQRWRYFGRGNEAEQAARVFDATIRATSSRSKSGPTFTQLVNRYVHAKAGLVAESTMCNWEWKFSQVILPEIGHLMAETIDESTLDHYVTTRLQRVKRVTVARELSDIQAVLNWAANRRFISQNRAAGYRKPRRDDAIIDPPSLEELAAIWAHASPQLRRAVLLVYFTGIRPGRSELLALTWDDYHPDTGILTVRSAAKGGPRVRRIPVHKQLAEHLNRWYEADDSAYPGAQIRPIVHNKGQRVGSLKTTWKSTLRRAKIQRRLRMYDLRHAAITALVARGDLKTVSSIAGHSREDTTLRVYAHSSPDLARELVDRVPALELDNVKTENLSQVSQQTQSGSGSVW